MQKYRTPWSRRAGTKMIELGIDTTDLAKKTGKTRQYIASVIYGRVDSPVARKQISDILGISDSTEPDG